MTFTTATPSCTLPKRKNPGVALPGVLSKIQTDTRAYSKEWFEQTALALVAEMRRNERMKAKETL